MTDASFEERSAWVQLGCLLLAGAGYFALAWPLLSSGVTVTLAYAPVFALAVVLLVVLLVGGHLVAVCFGGSDDGDERDRLVAWRAESMSSWVLGAGVLLAVAGLVFGLEGAWVANGLIYTLFLSEIAKVVFQLVYYRRGMIG